MAAKWIETRTGSLGQKKQDKQDKARLEVLPEPYGRAAVDGTPVREIVGDDPAGFAETFGQGDAGKRWIDRERARLNEDIEDAEREERT